MKKRSVYFSSAIKDRKFCDRFIVEGLNNKKGKSMEDRFNDIMSDPNNLLIGRVKKAGLIENGFVVMHNGVKVLERGFYNDEDNYLKILNGETEVGSIYVEIENVDSIQIDYLNYKLGISYSTDTLIYYNFFNVRTNSFLYPSFDTVHDVEFEIVDFDMGHNIDKDLNSLDFAYVMKTANAEFFEQQHRRVNEFGLKEYISFLVYNNLSSGEYISLDKEYNSMEYNYISNCSYDAKKMLSEYKIIALGAEKRLFTYGPPGEGDIFEGKANSGNLYEEILEIGINSGGINFSKPIIKLFNDVIYLCFSDKNNVYCLMGEGEPETFNGEELFILGNQRFKYGNYSQFLDVPFEDLELECMWNNIAGDFLTESKMPLITLANEDLDPICESSSSSNSSDSSESSDSSSSSVSSDSSVSESSVSYSSESSNSTFSTFSTFSSDSSESSSSYIQNWSSSSDIYLSKAPSNRALIRNAFVNGGVDDDFIP